MLHSAHRYSVERIYFAIRVYGIYEFRVMKEIEYKFPANVNMSMVIDMS